MKIQIKRFSESVILPERIEQGDWIDLRSAVEVNLLKGQLRRISLGVGMKLPEGYEAIIACRSSTPERFGIIQANGIGIIDNSYSGDEDCWNFLAYAVRDTVIHKNDRICQFRIIKSQPQIEFEEVDRLDEVSRNGFGSTGWR